jgi:hypothetical protein
MAEMSKTKAGVLGSWYFNRSKSIADAGDWLCGILVMLS